MKNTLIIIGLALVALVLGTFLFLYGRGNISSTPSPAATSPVPAATATDVPFTELAHGVQSTVSTRTNYLITSASQLAELWKMIDAHGQTPVVDFATHDVIAVFAGQKPTAGYAIAVAKVTDDAAARDVTITVTSPGGSCLLAQTLTAPYQVIELPKSSLTLTHTDQSATTSCLQ